MTPLVFVPNTQISEVKKGNIYSFDEIGDSYSVKANPSLIKYFSEYLPSEITIPNEYKGLPVTEIECSGFSHCYSLTSITIPNSVTSIGEYAFYECDNLDKVFYAGSVDEWFSISVGNGNEDLKNSVYYYSEEEPRA